MHSIVSFHFQGLQYLQFCKNNIAIFSFVVCALFAKPVNSQQFIEKSQVFGVSHTLAPYANLFGAGVSFYDFDNDGWDDLTLIGVNNYSSFYRNIGGSFQPAPFALFTAGDVKQMTWVDYDNDGDNDLVISVRSGGDFKIYRNDGNWVFTDVTASAGLLGLNTENYGFAFGDYDKDGFLDFYLCRYHSSGSPTNPLLTNALYKNNGDGTFTNVTTSAGVGNGIATSFTAIWIDYNEDSWQDIYVINDRMPYPNVLYRNNGNGTFTDVTSQTNTAMIQINGLADEPMSGTFADFDNDGDLDIYSSNTGSPATQARLLVNQGGVSFTELAQQYGVNLAEWAWGATFVDIDNDTWQDLYVSTATISLNTATDVKSYLYKSNAGISFTDNPSAFINHSNVAPSYSVAKGDINNDGFADLVVANGKNVQSFLWQNTATSPNNYVKVTLKGTLSNKMAIGSWIRVYAGGQTFTHYTRCGENYCSQNSQHHIFGMGAYQNIDSITVSYLSGIQDVYYNLPVNQHYTFIEGETLSMAINTPTQTSVCQGMSVVLTAPNFAQYAWNTGAQSQSITVTQSGEYFLTAVNAQGHIYHSDTITIFVSDPVNIVNESTDASCYGVNDGSVTLQVQNQTNNYAINWSNGAQGIGVEALGSGSYTYNYMDEFGCIFLSEVTIFEPEEIVVFTEITPQTSASLGSLMIAALGGNPPFLYYLNGNLASINNELQSGSFVLTVVDAEGCEVILDVVVPFDDDSSIDGILLQNIVVYPNPTTQAENLQIQMTSGLSASSMKMVDGSGRIVYELKNTATQSPLVIPTAQLESGVYYVMLEIDGLWITRKVVLSDE